MKRYCYTCQEPTDYDPAEPPDGVLPYMSVPDCEWWRCLECGTLIVDCRPPGPPGSPEMRQNLNIDPVIEPR